VSLLEAVPIVTVVTSRNITEWLRFTINIVKKSTIFWFLTPCSLVEIRRHFGGTDWIHFQGREVNEARNESKQAESLLLVSCLAYSSTLKIPPKRRCISTGLRGVTNQDIVFFRHNLNSMIRHMEGTREVLKGASGLCFICNIAMVFKWSNWLSFFTLFSV
jgi:hypothetical protein